MHPCLNLVANKAALAYALPNKEPTGNLSDNNSLHGGLGPFEGKSVLGQVADAPHHATNISRGHQLHLSKGGKSGDILEDKPLPGEVCLHKSHDSLSCRSESSNKSLVVLDHPHQ